MSEAIAEAPADGADEPVGSLGDEAAAEAAAAEVTPEPEATPAPVVPTLDPLEVQAQLEALSTQSQQFQEAFQYLLSRGATPEQAQDSATQQTGFDPSTLVDELGFVNPSALADLFKSEREQTLSAIDERLKAISAPLEERQRQEHQEHVAGLIDDMVADDMSRNGDLTETGKNLLGMIGSHMMPDLQSRYGNGPKTWELAVKNAGEIVRAFAKEAREQAVTEHVNRNATLANQHVEPGSAAAGLVTTSDEILPQGAVARKWAANAQRIRTP